MSICISSKDSLCLQLYHLKKMRGLLADMFIKEDPDIFKPMFDFEEDSTLTKLSIEKNKVTWLDAHWSEFDNFLSDKTLPEEAKSLVIAEFAQNFLHLLNSYEVCTDLTEFSRHLLREKQTVLKKIIKAGEKHTDMFNKLIYSHGRDRRLFDRKIKDYQEAT